MSTDLIRLWQKAWESKVGIAVSTNDRGLLRQQLYRARGEAKDPRFDDVVVIFPENGDELWIVHKDADE